MGRLLSFIEGVLFLCVCCLVLSNCGSNGCVDNRSSIPLAQFYSYDAQETALSVDSISIFGIGQPTDSMLLDSAVAVTQVYLPLRFTQDSTQYVIHYRTARSFVSSVKTDTLTFVYRSYPISCQTLRGDVYFVNRYVSVYTYILDSVSETSGHTIKMR